MRTLCILVALCVCAPVLGKCQNGTADDNTAEIVAKVLTAETAVIAWGDDGLICLSVGGEPPSEHLMGALRERKLNVRGDTDGRCALAISLELKFDRSEEARVYVQSYDCRGLDCRDPRFAEGLKPSHEIEYSLRKTDGRWSIYGYGTRGGRKETNLDFRISLLNDYRDISAQTD